MLILFLDESGDHSLDKIDKQYPLFVLAGCIMEEKYHNETAQKELDKLKINLFGKKDIILHTADITRNRNGFEDMKSKEFRERLYSEINALMRNLDYEIVACAIKKEHHLDRYGLSALDPYMLSLDCIIERFIFLLNERKEEGLVIAESRDDVLNNQLELAFLNLKISGTRFISAADIKRKIKAFSIRQKEENLAGLQIADLIASPIGRFVLGKKIHEDFKIVESKFRRGKQGRYEGFGLVILPKK